VPQLQEQIKEMALLRTDKEMEFVSQVSQGSREVTDAVGLERQEREETDENILVLIEEMAVEVRA